MSALALRGGDPVRRAPFPSVQDHSGRLMGAEEVEALSRVIASGCLTRNGGREVAAFEAAFAQTYGARWAVASTSGTAAVHLAMGALDLHPGDEVITGPVSDFGSLIGLLYEQGTPVFADLEPETFGLDPQAVERLITPRTRAILAVHLFGNPGDLAALRDLAVRRGIPLIEDCSQAHLAAFGGRYVGTWGDIGCFSLQQSKHMTTGEGGVTITSRPDFAERMRLFQDKAWPRDGGRREHLFLAPNYRMTELQGAVARVQLERVAEVVRRRRQLAALLDRGLAGHPYLQTPAVRPGAEHSYWLYALTVRTGSPAPAARWAEALRAEGIPASAGYLDRPMYLYPVLQDRRRLQERLGREVIYEPGLCPVAEALLRSWLILPVNERMMEVDVADIVRAVDKVTAHLDELVA